MSALDIGVTLKGLVIEKTNFQSKKGKELYNVTLVVGGEVNPIIWVNEDQFKQFTEMEIVEVPVEIGLNEYNGSTSIAYRLKGDIKRASKKAA